MEKEGKVKKILVVDDKEDSRVLVAKLNEKVAQLEESEEKYRTTFENTGTAMVILEEDTTISLANHQFEILTGYSKREIEGKRRWTEFVHQEDLERMQKYHRQRRESGEAAPTQYEFRFVDKEGNIKDIFLTIDVFPGTKKSIASLMDITKRKQVEERIAHLTLVLRAIRSVNQFIIREKDREKLLKGSCDNLVETRGYFNAWITLLDESGKLVAHAECGLGKSFLPIVERLKRGQLLTCGQRALKQPEAVVTEDPVSTCTDCPLSSNYAGRSAAIVRLEYGGKVYGLLSVAVPRELATDVEELGLFHEVATDIAFALHNMELEEERKRAEDALRESEEKYKTLVEATSDIIWEADEEGVFTFISPRIKDILGYEVDEVVGKMRTLDLIAKGEARKWLKRFKEINAKKMPFSGFEITHLHKNGTPVIFETSGIPLFDSDGNFKGYVGIDRDITERRQMQEQLVITDRLASVGELAAGIAHELNNPLTGVIGFSQLLLDKEMPDDIRQDVQVVYDEAQRTSQVVKNLLTFARKHTAVKQMLNINDVIEKVLELRAYEQKVENIMVKGRLASDLPEVMADYFQLQQVFLNIIINAEHFMKEAHNKGTLTVTTEQVGNKVKASFADDGPGIADENLGHLFDPFFTTKEVGSGTGLGLSICHGIITEHGGRIYVKSELGKGATFIVELPIGAAKKKGGAA